MIVNRNPINIIVLFNDKVILFIGCENYKIAIKNKSNSVKKKVK